MGRCSLDVLCLLVGLPLRLPAFGQLIHEDTIVAGGHSGHGGELSRVSLLPGGDAVAAVVRAIAERVRAMVRVEKL